MKILYLAHRIPYPPNKGDKIRSFNEIKYLSKSHKIDLICLADDKDDLRYQKDLEKYCERVFVLPFITIFAKFKGLASLLKGSSISAGYFYFKRAQKVFNQWLAESQYSAIICFSSPMAEYVFRSRAFQLPSFPASQLSGLPASRPLSLPASPPPASNHQPKLVCDFCDLDSDKWRQYSNLTMFPLNMIYRMESKRLLKLEKKVNGTFDHSIFVSQNEVDLFSKLHPAIKNVTVIPNGVDTEYFSSITVRPAASVMNPAPSSVSRSSSSFSLEPSALSRQHPMLLFTGAMDYHANIDGVVWFCTEILPLIKKEYPKVKFYIVGSSPHPKIKALDNNGIKVTGFVEDIRSYYNSADVCVIPLRLARGVQNKVLEAMAMGKPVVSTSNSVQGIKEISGEIIMIADDPIDFASKITLSLGDQTSREQIGLSARKFVKKNYRWKININKLDKLLNA